MKDAKTADTVAKENKQLTSSATAASKRSLLFDSNQLRVLHVFRTFHQ